MGFVSNIFKRADKDVKYTYSGKTGSSGDIVDVRGYSKAVIQFSGERVFAVCGCIEKATDSDVVFPIVTTLEHRPIVNNHVTEKNIIVDVSDISIFYFYFNESYTGDVFIHLTQDEVELDRSGITQIATKYINVVSGTNVYESGWIESAEIKHFRFIAVEIRRRDGNGYQPFTGRGLLYYNVNKEQGAGSECNSGDEIINVTNAYFVNSGWTENYATERLSLDIYIDGTEFNGALLEINFIGIA